MTNEGTHKSMDDFIFDSFDVSFWRFFDVLPKLQKRQVIPQRTRVLKKMNEWITNVVRMLKRETVTTVSRHLWRFKTSPSKKTKRQIKS